MEGSAIDQNPASEARVTDDPVLDAAMSRLPEDLRVLILLWAVEELSYKEMADVLQVPIGTVMSRLHRAKSQLREYLESQGDYIRLKDSNGRQSR